MFKAKLYRVLPGKVEEWKDWCKELQTTFAEEAKFTIQDEGNFFEGGYCFEIAGEYYTFGFAEGEFLPVDSENELNKKHYQKKQACLGEEISLQALYFLKVG